MSEETLRYRGAQDVPQTKSESGVGESAGKKEELHPAGRIKHAPWVQTIRMFLATTWFLGCTTILNVTQLIGSPLYFYNRDYFYAWMAFTKQSFAIVLNVLAQGFCPTTIRVSWDSALKGQFKRAKDGRLESSIPERIIFMSNHQIYTDWLYLWWFAYTSRMHGHVFILLKDTLRYIPVLGTGMMFFGFIFLARKWTSDKPRLQHRLSKLKSRHSGPLAGSAAQLDPMWLLIFPEGTNLSANTRKRSAKWSESQGIEDLKYQLLPRSTGLYFCLTELKGTVEYVYDCTMAYEGTPKGGYAQDYFTIKSTFLQGRPPKSVNMYWRRFAIADIPLQDDKSFGAWLLAKWQEKDELMQQFFDTGRFPAGTAGIDDAVSDNGYIETEAHLEAWWEVGQIFIVLATCALIANVVATLFSMFSR